MSELERFRDHCREMANWQPPKTKERTLVAHMCRDLRERYPHGGDEFGPHHGLCAGTECACECHPRPEPVKGPTDEERALWARLADEVDAYLTTDEDEGLFA